MGGLKVGGRASRSVRPCEAMRGQSGRPWESDLGGCMSLRWEAEVGVRDGRPCESEVGGRSGSPRWEAA